MGPTRSGNTRSPSAPAAPAEPAPATDRTDAPLVSRSANDADVTSPKSTDVTSAKDPGDPETGLSLTKEIPTEMPKFDCSMAGFAALGFKVVDLCGLPSPPGGWLGPFGFFRLVTYAFIACSLLAIVLGLMAATGQPFAGVPFIGGQPDGFATFAALLLCFGAIVSAGAAYAHEGLEQEVTAMKKQNDIFKSKNEMLAAQLNDLSDTRVKLQAVQQKMGENLQQFEETLQELHTVSCAELLQLMLEAFITADTSGVKDCRLVGDEVDALFDICEASLKEAAPDFNLDHLIGSVTETGIGICNLRFLANAAVAGCDKVPGRSTAMLTLVMFSAHPEKYEHELAIALRSVLDKNEYDDEKIAAMLTEKKTKANPQDHGRIFGTHLMDISRLVMSADLEGKNKEDQKPSGSAAGAPAVPPPTTTKTKPSPEP
ncbi:ATP synthase subunit gamma [Durusdinium trenchii]|uniref:Mitochondrial n=1 Tax=Durusdinium trenchii TaxID=1381693 RepID=A0ABP0I1Y3_9DINO